MEQFAFRSTILYSIVSFPFLDKGGLGSGSDTDEVCTLSKDFTLEFRKMFIPIAISRIEKNEQQKSITTQG